MGGKHNLDYTAVPSVRIHKTARAKIDEARARYNWTVSQTVRAILEGEAKKDFPGLKDEFGDGRKVTNG